MNLQELQLLIKYLQISRTKYGNIGIGLSLPEWSTQTAYGFFKDNIVITDSNSIFVLNFKSKIGKIVLTSINKEIIHIKNVQDWYQNMLDIAFNSELFTTPNLSKSLLNEEQLKFYRFFLSDNREEIYNEHEKLLIGRSKKGEAYVYTKKSL